MIYHTNENNYRRVDKQTWKPKVYNRKHDKTQTCGKVIKT